MPWMGKIKRNFTSFYGVTQVLAHIPRNLLWARSPLWEARVCE